MLVQSSSRTQLNLVSLAKPLVVRNISQVHAFLEDPTSLRVTGTRTRPRQQMYDFFGRAAINGDYSQNLFCYAPKNHIPNYIPFSSTTRGRQRIIRDREQQLHQSSTTSGDEPKVDANTYRPFPLNPYAKTAFQLSPQLKSTIISAVQSGQPIHEVSSIYGVKVERILAIIKLASIEEDFKTENKLTPDLKRFGRRMFQMLPVTNARLETHTGKKPVADVLGIDSTEEIVVPPQTKNDHFIVLEEDAAFGSDDAAQYYGVKPAKDLLESLKSTQFDRKHSYPKGTVSTEDDRFIWKVVPAKAGSVGYRYGASRDDRKKYRKHYKNPELNV
ncbi:eukaryotic mitochondrial regulator protein-domain-containing protein [Lipomyces japonicus]|uniref:mitochondrial 37S ribosomal protein mS45 n=1 Tax=Lipomyces japonicus TaxID=56871 RepID=UPI0034CFF064